MGIHLCKKRSFPPYLSSSNALINTTHTHKKKQLKGRSRAKKEAAEGKKAWGSGVDHQFPYCLLG